MRQTINHALVKKLPTDHFGSVTSQVLDLLTSGSCCSVYGIPGYGMEFFAKHVVNLLNDKSPIVNTLLINTEYQKNPDKLIERYICGLMNTQDLILDKFTNYMSNNKIVIVLGEVLTSNHIKLYKLLNYLKWYSKDNFTVLTVANYSILTNFENYLKIAQDIFHPRILISNFTYEGTVRIIELNNKEYNWKINGKHFKHIFELAGGNPALTKYICMAMYEEDEDILYDIPRLIKLQPLAKRLQDITELAYRLNRDEQRKIGFINENNKIFSPLIEYCIKNIANKHIDILLPQLTRNERKIFALMTEVENNVIDKDQIALVLGQDLENYSEWAIYKAMERLKNKVQNNYKIETVKGKGWTLK